MSGLDAKQLRDKYSALGGKLDAETRQRVERIENAEKSAHATAEDFCLTAGGVIERLHHHAPFLTEVQKLALDARQRLSAAFMVGENGELPPGITEGTEGANLLEHVCVYATSRPLTRWVLDDAVTFAALASEIRADVHCDAAAEPFFRSLAHFYPKAMTPDCVGLMAEHAAIQRGKTPNRIAVGQVFPIAFGSEIVVLKLCHAHADALVKKYRKPVRDTGLEEPWESVGNYW